MTELVGDALEQDETFYNNDVWASDSESGENESYVEEEENVPDQFDSDFNDSEDDDEDEDSEEDNVRKRETQQKRKTGHQDNKYREPAKMPSFVKRKAPVSSEPGDQSAKKSKSLVTPKRTSLARTLSCGSMNSDVSMRSVRGSTVAKTAEAHVARQIAFATAKPKTPKVQVKVSFTQKELLLEALATEEVNARWIERSKMEANAKESLKEKQAVAHNAGFKRFVSRKGAYDTITFSDYDSMPYILKLKPAGGK
jgi:hypothetical protein